MKITKFSEVVAAIEGKKKSVNIAQIKEILKITNKLTDGWLYQYIIYTKKTKSEIERLIRKSRAAQKRKKR